jgi:hypothetical protein
MLGGADGAGTPVIRVSLAVRCSSTRFTMEVQAESITHAVSSAVARYPGCGVMVLFPIDPEAFFADVDSGTLQAIPLGVGRGDTLPEALRRSGSMAV